MADVDLAEFFIELKRRRVVRVALVYGAVAFAALQTADLIFPLLELPPWTVKLVLGGTIVGLPIALVLAWAYELTPDGMRRTEPANTTVPPARRSRARSLATAMVLLVCLVAGGWATYASRIPDAAARSIAVLPFSNLSADRANEYFADGIHEQVLTQLSQIADLHVISRTSVMQYKQAQRNLREIARSLSVGSVLEGSVQREGKRVRITAQLVDARRDRHLWSQSYDRDLTDVFAIQSDIAQEIAGALRAELTGQERAALATPPTRNVEAYDAYLRASQHSGTRQELPARLELYQRAVALDSTFLLAQIGVANTLMDLREQHVQYDVTQRIADAVRRAVQLAPASAETRVLLSRVKERSGDFGGALAEAALAREVQPNNPAILTHFGGRLVNRGMFAEAARLLQQVIELDPANGQAHLRMGWAMAGQRRWAEAEQHIDRAIALAPRDPSLFLHKFDLRAAHVESVEGLRALLDDGLARYDRQALARIMTGASGLDVPMILQLRSDFFDAMTLGAGVDSLDFALAIGLARARQGQIDEARAAFEQDRRIGEARIKARFGATDGTVENLSNVAWAHSDLALALAALRRTPEAIAAAKRGVELFPLSLPAPPALYISMILARVYIMTDRPDEAIAVLQGVVAAPHTAAYFITPNRPRIDPMFASLRGKPAFDQLTSRAAQN